MLFAVFIGIFIIINKDVGIRKILKSASGIQIFVFVDISALDPCIGQRFNTSVCVRHHIGVRTACYKSFR